MRGGRRGGRRRRRRKRRRIAWTCRGDEFGVREGGEGGREGWG